MAVKRTKELSVRALGVAALLFAVTSGTAWAQRGGADPMAVLKVKIDEVSPSLTALTEGGSPLAQGDWSASPSITLRYELVANAFPAFPTVFGTFDLASRSIRVRAAAAGRPSIR